MANRYLKENVRTFENAPVLIAGRFAVGATGAVGTIDAKGVKSVTRDSAGVYTIKLEDSFLKILHAEAQVRQTTLTDLDVKNKTFAADSFTFHCDVAGTATDPANGDDVTFLIVARNSGA